jgi:hypothetical protein
MIVLIKGEGIRTLLPVAPTTTERVIMLRLKGLNQIFVNIDEICILKYFISTYNIFSTPSWSRTSFNTGKKGGKERERERER